MENREYLTLTQAANCLPNRPHPAAIWRWMRVGLKARDGERIRLHHMRIGGRLYTTEEDLYAFFRLLAEADMAYFRKREEAAKRSAENMKQSTWRPRTEKQRAAAIEAARRELKSG